MKFIKQSSDLCIQNYDSLCGQEPHRKRHGCMLPDTVRAIFVGSSGCGKTNAVFNLLFSKRGLRFKNIYVFCKSLQQKKYSLLENVMKGLPGVGYFTYSDNNAVMHPNDALPHSVMIFDDISLERQNNVKNYFCFGRHNNIDSVYIGQSYANIGKHYIRDNTNFLAVWSADSLNLKHIHADHVAGDMSFEEFKELCRRVWESDRHAFVVIDKESPLNRGRYRKNFDTFIDIYK
jgi:hypothetical protein